MSSMLGRLPQQQLRSHRFPLRTSIRSAHCPCALITTTVHNNSKMVAPGHAALLVQNPHRRDAASHLKMSTMVSKVVLSLVVVMTTDSDGFGDDGLVHLYHTVRTVGELMPSTCHIVISVRHPVTPHGSTATQPTPARAGNHYRVIDTAHQTWSCMAL